MSAQQLFEEQVDSADDIDMNIYNFVRNEIDKMVAEELEENQ